MYIFNILSEYTNTIGMEMASNPTLNTATMEISDPDEFQLYGSTLYETNTIETSDEDEFLLM